MSKLQPFTFEFIFEDKIPQSNVVFCNASIPTDVAFSIDCFGAIPMDVLFAIDYFSAIPMDVLFAIDSFGAMDVPFVMQSNCIILDLVLTKKNIRIQKKKKKAYELNRHFQNTWTIKLLWVEFVFSFDRKVIEVLCKVCTQIKERDKFLIPKLGFSIKTCRLLQGFGVHDRG